jgi:hypothetical protein
LAPEVGWLKVIRNTCASIFENTCLGLSLGNSDSACIYKNPQVILENSHD